MAQSFIELIVWQKANELRKLIYKITAQFPADEKFNLTSQLRRASFSVGANIAEGFGRFHFKENTQYCRQARGSLEEVFDGILFAKEMNFMDNEAFNIAESLIDDCRKLLNAYIRSIGTTPQSVTSDSMTL